MVCISMPTHFLKKYNLRKIAHLPKIFLRPLGFSLSGNVVRGDDVL